MKPHIPQCDNSRAKREAVTTAHIALKIPPPRNEAAKSAPVAKQPRSNSLAEAFVPGSFPEQTFFFFFCLGAVLQNAVKKKKEPAPALSSLERTFPKTRC